MFLNGPHFGSNKLFIFYYMDRSFPNRLLTQKAFVKRSEALTNNANAYRCYVNRHTTISIMSSNSIELATFAWYFHINYTSTSLRPVFGHIQFKFQFRPNYNFRSRCYLTKYCNIKKHLPHWNSYCCFVNIFQLNVCTHYPKLNF